jgi:curved DNA-binding protein CbpA
MTELDMVAAQLEQAEDYLAVFGECSGPPEDIALQIKQVYHKLALVLHPDRYIKLAEVAVAGRAFQRLNQLQTDAKMALSEGRYGQKLWLAIAQGKHGRYGLLQPLGAGDLTETYAAKIISDIERPVFCKVATQPDDKDLLETEAAVLRRLRSKDVDQAWTPFIPELLDSFTYNEANKPPRVANALAKLEGFYNLEQIKRAFPYGVEPLHMVWIWRKLLAALGHAHDNKVVHGAVLPRHVMILPSQHGLVLVDWCYASLAKDDVYPPIKAIVDEYKSWYPANVFAKQAPGPATDIAMAARCMVQLVGGDPLTGNVLTKFPRPFKAYFRGCLQTNGQARPDDAWRLLKEFDELLEEMGPPYYPRRFRPFVVPAGIA